MGGGGKSGSATIGFKYFMGMHMVFCHGPVDFVGPIYAGKRLCHAGRSSSGIITIDKPGLFGGEKKEGGIKGPVDVMMGESTQGQNAYLVSKLGSSVPGYRGVVSLVANKCMVCAMSPYPKAWAAQVKRIPGQDWYPAKANINSGSANGAHIIRETILNTDWGLGYPSTAIDNTSFTSAADALYSEGLGLSMLLSGQGSVEDFLQQVLRHVNGALYVDRLTGKFKLKLLREDYVVGSLPVFDTTNIKEMASYQRPTYAEMINEVVLVYRPRGAFSDDAVTVQDLASIQAQGGVVSQTMQYPGIDTAANASLVGVRELKQNSTPLAKVRFTANRDAWALNPGDAFKLSWAPKGISQLILRAIAIDYGGLASGMIEVSAVEDIFGVPAAAYAVPQGSLWTDPVGDAVPVPESRVEEVPYWDLAMQLSPADLDYIEDTDCFFHYFAREPAVASSSFGLWTRPTGVGDFARVEYGSYSPTVLLAQDLNKTQETGILIAGASALVEDVDIGTYAYIGQELVRVDDVDATAGTMAIGRGCLDSSPAEHTSGTRVWFAEEEGATDPSPYLPAESVDGRATPVTGTGELDVSAASTQVLVMAGRQFRPYPPGRFAFNAVYFPAAVIDGLSVSWVHRDRTLQTARPIIDHFDGTIGPEAGTTYTASFYGERDLVTTPLRTAAGMAASPRVWTEELVDAGLYVYAPVDTHSFRVPMDTNHRVEGPDQTVGWAVNTGVTFDGEWAQFSGSNYLDVEDIDEGETLSIVFSIDGGSYSGGAVERTVVDKSSAAGANIFSLVLYNGSFRAYIGALGGTSFASWATLYSRDHDFLVTVEKNQPAAGQTRTSVYMDGVLLGQTSAAAVIGAMAGKSWAVGAGWSSAVARDKYMIARMHGLAFFKALLTASQVWPEQRLNDRLRVTLKSVRDAQDSRQSCDHTADRAGFGYRFGQYFGGV
jgi:hypothetical protein